MVVPERVPRRPGYELTLRRILEHGLRVAPDAEIVYVTSRGRGRYTLSQAAWRMERLAAALASVGVGRLDRVATLDWNTHWHFEAYFAVPMMGAVLHTVNVRLAPGDVAYVMSQAGDRVAIVNGGLLGLLEAVAARVKTLELVVVVDSDSVPGRVGGVRAVHYEDFIREHGGFEWPELDEDQPAGLCYTSGSTGRPKGVYHSHRMLVLHTLSAALHLAGSGTFTLTARDVVMHVVPMYHVYSWGFPYMATLLGAKQVYPGRFTPESLLELIREEGVTFTASVPTVLHMVLTHPESRRYDLRGLKWVIGGSALPRRLALAAAERGIEVVAGYGLTETAPILTIATPKPRHLELPPEEQVEARARSGYPLPLVDVMVVDEEMKPVPRDGKTMGEVVVRAPWAAPEYIGDPEGTREAWRGGWLHTGDVAVWFEDGSILVTDREKDLIKSGGEWISSTRLEDAISQHPGVAQVAVIPARHPTWGERPVAVIVPKPGWEGKLTTEEVREFLTRNFVEKGEMPKWWLPDKVILARDLPKTGVGKVDKRLLRERYAGVLEEHEQPGG
ncbi:long-chain-fatty-acid--CoA ligase [Stetteria hydrogenophila]